MYQNWSWLWLAIPELDEKLVWAKADLTVQQQQEPQNNQYMSSILEFEKSEREIGVGFRCYDIVVV